MAKSAVLISKKSTRNDFGWPKPISFFKSWRVIFPIVGILLDTHPDIFESFIRLPKGSSFPIAIAVFFSIIFIASLVFAYEEVAYKPSLGTTSSTVLLVPRSIETGILAKPWSLVPSLSVLCIQLGHLDRLNDDRPCYILITTFGFFITLFDIKNGMDQLSKCQLIKLQNVDKKIEEHDRLDSLRNPEELSKKHRSSTTICQQKISTPQQRSSSSQYHMERRPNEHECNLPQQYDCETIKHQREELIERPCVSPTTDLHNKKPSSEQPQQQQNHTPKESQQTLAGAFEREESLHDEMDLDENFCSGAHERTTNELQSRSSSQQPQQQQNDAPKPSKQIVADAFEREELTLQHKTDLDDNTDNFCSSDHERTINELQRTLSEHWQQQKQESHHPEPNTPTRERRTRTWKRYNPDTQTTPQDTHERSKRQRVSNDQRKKHFYMDSGAAYHSTFDPSVIKSYPARLKPPIQAIQGFGGSTILVTGYGYIDGPGGKLKHVLLLPDSTANLMCLGQLTRDYPVKVVFYKDKFWIEGLHNGERIGEGHREDVNHYVVDRFQPDSLLINKRKPSKKKARQYTR